MTLLTAGALTDPRLPATASNVCTTDARLGGVGRVPPPPQQKSWLRRWRWRERDRDRMREKAGEMWRGRYVREKNTCSCTGK